MTNTNAAGEGNGEISSSGESDDESPTNERKSARSTPIVSKRTSQDTAEESSNQPAPSGGNFEGKNPGRSLHSLFLTVRRKCNRRGHNVLPRYRRERLIRRKYQYIQVGDQLEVSAILSLSGRGFATGAEDIKSIVGRVEERSS